MKRRALYAGLIIFTGFILFYKLGSYPLIEPSDARYAEIAREMMVTGDYVTPRVFGIKHFHKPPLIFWTTALGYRIFGVNEWGARFFQGVFGLLILFLVYRFSRTFLGEEKGLLSALLLLLMPGFIVAERNLTTDLLLLLAVTGALASFYGYYADNRRKWMIYLFYISCGLSVLTKGHIGLIIIVPVILIFLALRKDLSFLKSTYPVRGISIILAISLPWFIQVGMNNPGILDYFIKSQVVARLKGGMGHKHPVTYFLLVFPALTFPWVFFLATPIRSLISKGLKGAGDTDRGLRLFLLIWAIYPFLFFSIPATKLPLYILPSTPPVAVLAADSALMLWTRERRERNYGVLFSGIFLFCAGIVSFLLPETLMAKKGISMTDGFQLLLYVSGAIMLLGGASVLFLSKNLQNSFLALVISLSLFFGTFVSMVDTVPMPTSKRIALDIKNESPGYSPLIIEEGLEVYGIPFYTGFPVYLHRVEKNLNFDGGKPAYFLDQKQYNHFMVDNRPYFIVGRSKRKVNFPVGRYLDEDSLDGFTSRYYPPEKTSEDDQAVQ